MRLSFVIVSSLLAAGAVSAVSAAACSSSTDAVGVGVLPDAEPAETSVVLEAGADTSGPDPLAGCTKDPGGTAPTFDPNSKTDPIGAASFTLETALAGFPAGTGKLTAAITTEKSFILCTLDETAAPISVANFVGLARGTRPYNITGKWQVGRFYDGLTFHRVIPDFVIQGGDPEGDGLGGPGYDVPNENHAAEPLGALAMAASGNPPDNVPSGSQFYIVVGTGPSTDYNVFGSCTTENAIAIAGVPRDANDKPNTPVHTLTVEIGRCP